MSSTRVSRGSRADESWLRGEMRRPESWSANEVAHTGNVTTARSHGCLPEQEVEWRAGRKWESQEMEQVVYDTAETQGIKGTCQIVRDVQPGSSGIGRSASDGASLSVFSSVEPAYGSSPFSPGAGGCLCSLCLATLGDQELWRVNIQGADTQTQGQANLPAAILPPQFILGVPGIFCPIVPSFCQ